MTDQNINLNQQDDIEVAGETVSGIEADADLHTNTAAEDAADFEDITIEEDAEARENTAPDAASKVAKLRAEIEKLKAEKQQYLDNWQRDKAEFVNARKRDEESKSDFLKFAGITFAEDLLPVIDSFEAALKHEGSKEGVELIYTQFKSVLKRQGVEEFGTIGESFDPSFHQAIGNEPTEDKAKDHTVADVLQKGYKIHSRVIRPAFVKVFQA
jgi:molecular chaperone GrpE